MHDPVAAIFRRGQAGEGEIRVKPGAHPLVVPAVARGTSLPAGNRDTGRRRRAASPKWIRPSAAGFAELPKHDSVLMEGWPKQGKNALSNASKYAVSVEKMAIRGRCPPAVPDASPGRLHQTGESGMLLCGKTAPKLPPGMSVDAPTVRRIAHLARLAIAEDELAPIGKELSRVLDLADALAAADTRGIEPMAHPHEQALAWRADVVTETDRADALLALAPEARGGFYLVPKVIE